MGAISLLLLCGLGAGGCSMSPSMLMSGPNAAIAPMSLVVDTIPSGAEARLRDGSSSCQTPCELTVTPMGPFTVDFALKNYEPQSVEVVLAALNPADLSAGIRLDPNPLSVKLTAIPRPPPKTKPVAKQQSTPKPVWPETAGAVWPQSSGR